MTGAHRQRQFCTVVDLSLAVAAQLCLTRSATSMEGKQ